MAVDTRAGEETTGEPSEEFVERDTSLSPIRTLDRERTFRLRDAAIALISGLAVYVGVWAFWSYVPLPTIVQQRFDWGMAFANLVIVAIVLMLARRRRIRIGELFLRDRRWYVEVFWGVGAFVAIWIGFVFADLLGFRPFDPVTAEIAGADLLTKWEFLIVGALFVPLTEELVFRGVVQGSLYARAGAFMACLFQALLFGALHWRSWEVVVAAGIMGLFLGALALWRAGLLAPIVAHGMWNGVAAGWIVVAAYLSQHVPAADMDQAQVPPAWALEPMTFGVPLENSGRAQYWKASETYGVEGWMLPKDEIRALLFVRERFPEDREFGGWASLRIAEIYRVELRDPRRAIVVADEILRERDHREIEVDALSTQACAHSDLGEVDAAYEAVDRMEREYGDLEPTKEYAALLRSWIEAGQAGK